MEYKLAKQLKEAGFKQDYHDCVGDRDGNCVCYNERWEKDVMTPTLSELIDACGGRLHLLKPTRNIADPLEIINWEAHQFNFPQDAMIDPEVHKAKTPEEAVAKLWLALN